MTGREVWKPVVGYEEMYEVSDYGRVKRIMQGAGAVAGRILKGGMSKGYRNVSFSRNGTRIRRKVHRVVLEAFLGARPKGLQCNHKDGNKQNNSSVNLEWVTRQENVDHAWEHLTEKMSFGENHSRAKLTEKDVMFIRANASPGVSNDPKPSDHSALARRFGISSAAIRKIVQRKTWRRI